MRSRASIRRRVPLAAAAALGLALCTLGIVPARAFTPQNRPHPEPEVPSSDGPVTALRPAELGRYRVLGPLGGTGSLALANVQSEMTIAASGTYVILGDNDFRGTTSSSGVLYSFDGGLTFSDGGQLPIGTGKDVLGDPCLTVYTPSGGGSPIFYYSSIFSNAAGLQTLCVHRSTNEGVSWSGPFEVTQASISGHSADKEWTTVDPETGRLFVAWTDFGGPVDTMKVTYSDDQGVTWSTAKRIGSNGQGSSIVCDPNNNNVYCAYYGYSGSLNATYLARSTDNGVTWTSGVVKNTYNAVVPPYGFDRSNSYPSICVSPANGDVYLLHPQGVTGQPTADFGDVYFQKSSDGGVTFTSGVALNAFPGTDRPQVFPTIAASTNGRIDVFWYDESIGSGVDDLTDLFYTYSTDMGTTWSSPVPVNSSPWHNEAGNNFSAPHQGDYIDATYNVANTTAYGAASLFSDPNILGNGPDGLAATMSSPAPIAALRVRPSAISFADHACSHDDSFLVAGESANLTLPLENFGRSTLTGITATLTSETTGANVYSGAGTYPTIAPGASASSTNTYLIGLATNYPCGQPAKFRLDINASGATSTYVEFTINTGVVASTSILLSENFDEVIAPALPAGWTPNNGCTTCSTNNWVTSTVTPASAPNAAFASDVTYSSFGRLFGPSVAIPAGVTYVDIAFDTSFNLESQDTRTAFDAASFEYQLDGVGGSHFATADCTIFDNRYTHYVVRASGGNNGDRSGWSGNSGGYKHVRVRIPSLAGHSIIPRFSLTTDPNTGVSGVWIDNVVITAITMGCGACTPTAVADGQAKPSPFSIHVAGANPFRGGTELRYTLTDRMPVRIDVFTLAGAKVRTLVDQQQNPGAYAVPFALVDGGGASLPAGVYVVRVTAGATESTLRVTALR